ncbi:unnamed protein product [Xylocopa violacea]|uniref:Uncharacterized protein n=1 Tax=Xylocopa violacea TaxID=135666 RepID=A0ABP1NWC4_XYLVO
MAENINANKHFDKLNTNLSEVIYPILIPPNWILQICLKDTLLLDKLHSHTSDCNNYSCMFSKAIKNETMKSILSIIRNDTIDDAVSQEFKQSVQDCLVWWKLFKHFDKNANPRRELGRCLFQTFSFKCREPVFDKIRLLLISRKEK